MIKVKGISVWSVYQLLRHITAPLSKYTSSTCPTQSAVSRPAAAASPGSLLEMQIFGLYPRSPESEYAFKIPV